MEEIRGDVRPEHGGGAILELPERVPNLREAGRGDIHHTIGGALEILAEAGYGALGLMPGQVNIRRRIAP